ncbi:MAG TPA: AMP-binding protein [Thermohalobaculum sp.]|nr:AMP-binding protein [Thermohalobaculum sp.]
MTLTAAGTIGAAFRAAARRWPDRPFLAVPARAGRGYLPGGWEGTYAACLDAVADLEARYATAGYGAGHRVALMLENRPEHVLHKLALNALGASVAPVNPEYRPAEYAYLVDHCRPDLIVTTEAKRALTEAAVAEASHRPPTAQLEDFAGTPGHAPRRAEGDGPDPAREASLLYTSGTTGRPKGCVMSHEYELAMGDWYASRGGVAAFGEGTDRVFNPLPLYHVNAGIMSLFGVMSRGNCLIVDDRFHPSTWWADVAATGATVVHYLGVIASMLMKRPEERRDRAHAVRFGFGAGIEPTLHDAFERRFGFPMVELWGMTEGCRILADAHEPRQVGTRAIGRPVPGLEVRVVDREDREAPQGEPGEMTIRHSAGTPRKHFFSGYLDDRRATEEAWRGGWFHTGDTVVIDPDGMIHFVDRAKNIIRRSGENISAAEVEAVLLEHAAVAQVAVAPLPDELREEEVLACVVAAEGAEAGAALAEDIARHCLGRLAYYKAPGWVLFLDALPTTGTQKIQKHRLFADGEDPRERPGMHDLRALKKRGAPPGERT